jgi:hypothetical protein
MLPILRDDALASTDDGIELRLCLPWIRSLPLSSVTGIAVAVDGDPLDVVVSIDDRRIAPERLADEGGWWFVQDRLVLRAGRMLRPGTHDVSVSFSLVIPYLPAGPDAPLTLPFHAEAALTPDVAHTQGVSLASRPDTGSRRITAHSGVSSSELRVQEESPNSEALPKGCTLGASAFNWTPDVIAADRSAPDIAVGIVAEGVADVIELELGQLWPSFPDPADADADALRSALDEVGGSVSIVGASIDDWRTASRRRSGEERLAFLIPQLRAAHRLGAHGVRLPIGQAGPALLQRVQPILEDLDLVLYEEVQGHQTPVNPAVAGAYETIADLDDPRIRLLVDISMLMPALPVSYLTLLREGGVPASLVDALETDWRSPAIDTEVVGLLRTGQVPPAVHTAYMNLLVRFGRSDAADLRSILPLIGGFHLKFWDLDDAGGRVSNPIRELGVLLASAGWRGSLTSEWGGHEWLDGDPTETTRRHLYLARTALGQGAETITDPKENPWLTP